MLLHLGHYNATTMYGREVAQLHAFIISLLEVSGRLHTLTVLPGKEGLVLSIPRENALVPGLIGGEEI